MQVFRTILVILTVTLGAGSAFAEVTLPAVFSDHMVLQHGQAVYVWGWAGVGEKVTVSIADRSSSTRAGQSNMAMTVSRAMNYQQEQAAANYPQIRHFKTASHAAPEPQDRCEGAWAVCSPDTVGAFTATGYFQAARYSDRPYQ